MNYYKRHLGDYARKAGHLSMLEHGAYNLILDAYYDREQAPTKAEALRWARARNPDETQTVSTILQEFFTERDGRYYQQRVEDELAAARAKCERNRELGKLGGRPPRARKTQTVSKRLANGSEMEPQSTNPLIHNLEAKDQKRARKSAPVLPEWLPQDAWDAWQRFRSARKGWTDDAKALCLRTLTKLREQGHEPRAVIEQSIERGWTGLFPVKADPAKPPMAQQFAEKTYTGTPDDELPEFLRAG